MSEYITLPKAAKMSKIGEPIWNYGSYNFTNRLGAEQIPLPIRENFATPASSMWGVLSLLSTKSQPTLNYASKATLLPTRSPMGDGEEWGDILTEAHTENAAEQTLKPAMNFFDSLFKPDTTTGGSSTMAMVNKILPYAAIGAVVYFLFLRK